jgi:two-component system response regulator
MSQPPELVLLVEDNEDDAALMLRAFKHAGIQNPVFVARDGIEALDFLFTRESFSNRVGHLPPKLVVLDLKLPLLDGLGVLGAMRADPRTSLVPVLILTSSFLEPDLTRCYALGANSYLVKPIDFLEFTEMARILGLFWLTMNRSPSYPAAA